MGSEIARHLIEAGYDVSGYDIDNECLQGLVALGGMSTASVTDLVGTADLVITSLPSEAAFRDVMSEMGQSAKAGLVVADTSTLPSHVKQSWANLLREGAITLLDCPLSGTGAQARTRDLVALMSGPPDEVEAITGVFAEFCRKRSYVGEFGRGSDIKLVANLLVAVHTLAAAEALLLADRTGLDMDVVIETLSDSAAGSRMLEVRGPMLASGDWREPTMRLDLFLKDLHLIEDFAEQAEAPTPLFARAVEYYRTAHQLGLGENDTASVMEALRTQMPSQDLDSPSSAVPSD